MTTYIGIVCDDGPGYMGEAVADETANEPECPDDCEPYDMVEAVDVPLCRVQSSYGLCWRRHGGAEREAMVYRSSAEPLSSARERAARVNLTGWIAC